MRTIITTAMVLCLLLAGCGNRELTTWALSSPSQDLSARVGLSDGGTEVYLTGKYRAADNVEWDRLTPDDIGAGILFHLSQDVSIEDTGEPSPLGPLLEALHARPYAGLELVGPLEGKDRSVRPNFIAGSTFTAAPDGNIGLVVEYIDGDQIPTGEVYIGGFVRF